MTQEEFGIAALLAVIVVFALGYLKYKRKWTLKGYYDRMGGGKGK